LVYAARGGPTTELWKIAAGGQTGAAVAAPAEYERRIAALFERALR
jgi:hypothetical protein